MKLDVLKAFSSKVIDIHSQHQSLLINKSNYQIQLIDRLASIKFKSHKKYIETYQSNLIELKTVKEELNKFVESLTSEDFGKIQKFYNTMPRLQHEVEVENPKTKVKSKIMLAGLQSFFVSPSHTTA